MRILDFNHCKLTCNCGWNIKIGGKSESELIKLKKFIKDSGLEDLTNYDEKFMTERF